MTDQQQKDSINSLQIDVAEIKTTLEKGIEPTLKRIELTLDEHYKKLESRIEVLERRDDSKKYFTRLEGKAVTAALTMAILLLTLWNLISKG